MSRVVIESKDGTRHDAVRMPPCKTTVYEVRPDGSSSETTMLLEWQCPKCNAGVAAELMFGCKCGQVCLIERPSAVEVAAKRIAEQHREILEELAKK